MKTMLIATGSEIINEELARAFQAEYIVCTCIQGDETLLLLQEFKPDILIINLSLTYITGLSVLQLTDYTPPAIIALSYYLSDLIAEQAQTYGVDALIQLPCSVKCIKSHLSQIMAQR